MIVNYFPNDLFVYRKPHKHDCSLRFIGRSDDLKILKIQCVIIMHANTECYLFIYILQISLGIKFNVNILIIAIANKKL